jgi:phytoene/squalene synthetase
MHEPPDENLDFALRHYPALRLSLPYVAMPLRQKMLALYGLLANIEASVYRASDPVVTRARLAWWLQELQQARNDNANHPISKQLHSSGALEVLPEELLGRLVVSTEQRLDLASVGDDTNLKTLCEGLGLIQLELELALLGEVFSEFPGCREFAAMNGLVQLLRESFRSRQASYSWIPLTLCAQFEMNRKSLAANPGSPECKALFQELAALGLSWVPVSGSWDSILKQVPEPRFTWNVHWLIMTNLQKRQLHRVSKGVQHERVSEGRAFAFEKPGILDAWSTWRLAHRINAWRKDQ